MSPRTPPPDATVHAATLNRSHLPSQERPLDGLDTQIASQLERAQIRISQILGAPDVTAVTEPALSMAGIDGAAGGSGAALDATDTTDGGEGEGVGAAILREAAVPQTPGDGLNAAGAPHLASELDLDSSPDGAHEELEDSHGPGYCTASPSHQQLLEVVMNHKAHKAPVAAATA